MASQAIVTSLPTRYISIPKRERVRKSSRCIVQPCVSITSADTSPRLCFFSLHLESHWKMLMVWWQSRVWEWRMSWRRIEGVQLMISYKCWLNIILTRHLILPIVDLWEKPPCKVPAVVLVSNNLTEQEAFFMASNFLLMKKKSEKMLNWRCLQ